MTGLMSHEYQDSSQPYLRVRDGMQTVVQIAAQLLHKDNKTYQLVNGATSKFLWKQKASSRRSVRLKSSMYLSCETLSLVHIVLCVACPSGAVLVRAKSPSHVRSVALVPLSVWRHHLGPFSISTNKLKCTVFFLPLVQHVSLLSGCRDIYDNAVQRN